MVEKNQNNLNNSLNMETAKTNTEKLLDYK